MPGSTSAPAAFHTLGQVQLAMQIVGLLQIHTQTVYACVHCMITSDTHTDIASIRTLYDYFGYTHRQCIHAYMFF